MRERAKAFVIRFALFLITVSQPIYAADYMLMVRSQLDFPETMLALQTAITEHGYSVSRVQRIDIGLTSSGYVTDKYRIVFYGKLDEIRELKSRHPHLIPYLPLHMAIYAEGEETLVVTEDMTQFEGLVTDGDLRVQFQRWKSDVLSIFSELSAMQ